MSDYCKGDKTEDDVLKATIDYEKHKIEQKIINQKYFVSTHLITPRKFQVL